MNEAPPEARATKRRFTGLTLVLVTLVGAGLAFGGAALLFHKPESDGAKSAGTKPTEQVHEKEVWQCPMHPSVVQDHPGTCPICGMKLVKLESATSKAASGHDGHDGGQLSSALGAAGAVEGMATVDIDPERQQLIGLTTVPATRGKVGATWRTVGKVAVDETRVHHVNVKVSGFVEQVFVDFVGRPVRRGDPLFSIYSPDLYAAQEEYLLALETRKALSQGGSLAQNGEALVASARRKLELWDVPERELLRLEKTGKAQRALTLTSPASGVVTRKDVVGGMKLEAGAMPYEIVDLGHVWVLADVYESELRLVKIGMPAALTLKAFPNRSFDGSVAFVDPLLDPKSRTVKVRLQFPNRTGELRPEMFGEVTLRGPSREALTIPTDAVISSGTRSVVFVALGQGKFAPRDIRLGDDDGNIIEVLSGLREGERVVTRANFLIDSESRLKAALSAMTPNSPASAPTKTPPKADDRPLPGGEGHSGHGGHPR